MKRFATAVAFSAALLLPAQAETSVYSPPLTIESTFSEIEGELRIHALEQGEGHTIVLLHGLPASAYLWRKVIPLAAENYHVVAPDLPGYGHSSTVPDYGLDTAARALSTYLDGLPVEKFTLVVTDIGSVLGLNYAVRNPDRIAGIVLSEAVFQLPEDFMNQIRPKHREFIMAAQDGDFVKQITIDSPALVDLALQNNSITELDEEVLANYRAPYLPPFDDHMDKRKTLNGVFGLNGLQNFGTMAAENAAGLADMDVPILLVVAKPGYMVNDPAIAYAKATFSNLEIAEIDEAGHFFAEDNPEAFAKALVNWLERTR